MSSNGQLTLPRFRERLGLMSNPRSMEKLLREYEDSWEGKSEEKEKARQAVENRKQEVRTQKKERAKTTLTQDDNLRLNCNIVICGAVMLSMVLNALACAVDFEVLLRTSSAGSDQHWKIVAEFLTTTELWGVSLAMVVRFVTAGFGVMIPLMMLGIAGVAAKCWHRYVDETEEASTLDWMRKQDKTAFGVGSAGVFLLILSLYHCTSALMIFGMPWYLALAFALGIDYGLVWLEWAKIKAFSRD